MKPFVSKSSSICRTIRLAAAIGELDSDDAVYILEDLDKEDRDDILSQLPFTERVRLRRALEYPESSAGRRMQTEFVAVPPFWTVGQTIDYMREEAELPDAFSQIFVIDPTFKLLGSVDLDRILRAKRQVKIEAIMRETTHPIPAEMDQEEAAQLFEQYDLLSAAVVDENERLVGVLTIDDVVDVIHEEADEDIKRLGGVGDEELSDNILSTVRSRFLWLAVNMVTAILSASIIGLFDGSIEKMIALAVLMPIVASMGGNAGTQTMTVTVRALATGDLDIYNAARVIRREAGVGLLNGILFAVVMGANCNLLVPRHAARHSAGGGDGHQPGRRSARRHSAAAAARPLWGRSRDRVLGLRHDGDGLHRLFFISWIGDLVVRTPLTILPTRARRGYRRE